jgi:hypothetical protein
MNDFDELASAYLDGEVTPDERALVDGDPAVLARVEELRLARDALASTPVVAPAPEARDAAIRAAVGVADVVDLTRMRTRRRLRLVAVAAAVLVVIGAAGLVLRSRTTESSTSTAAGTRSAASSALVPSAAAAAGATQPYGTGGSMLGTFTDRDALVSAAKAAIETPASERMAADAAAASNVVTTGTPPLCHVTAPADTDGPVFSALAVLDRTYVQVDVFLRRDGTRVLVATSSGPCTELFSQPL